MQICEKLLEESSNSSNEVKSILLLMRSTILKFILCFRHVSTVGVLLEQELRIITLLSIGTTDAKTASRAKMLFFLKVIHS